MENSLECQLLKSGEIYSPEKDQKKAALKIRQLIMNICM